MDYKPYPDSLGRDTTWDAVGRALGKLSDRPGLEKRISEMRIVLGLDGYVDSLYSLVAKRESVDKFEIMESMHEFATRCHEAAGSSCNIERVLKKRLGGGFGPNTARAIGTLGVEVDLIGCLGAPSEVFTSSLPSNVNLYSLGDPGETCALEFSDGKVMITDFGNVNNVTWDLIKQKVGRDRLIGMMERADAIGQGHWALVPHMSGDADGNDVWGAWISEVFPNVSPRDRYFFVDVADMTKRPFAHRREMVRRLEQLEAFDGMHPVMSMNDKEAIQIAEAFDGLPNITDFEQYYTIGEKMMERFNIHAVIIHHPHFATITTKENTWHVKEGYTSKPRFTTAAGDHFNGGALVALASGLFEPDEAMVIANAATACFVRTGESPTFDDITRFVDHYREYVENDLDKLV